MNDRQAFDHTESAEMLPDYAVGALDDGDLRRVEAHIKHCGICQRDLAIILETVGVLVEVAPPRPGVKAAVLAHARQSADSASSVLMESDQRRRVTPWPKGVAWIGLAAAVVALVVGLTVWNRALDQRLDERTTIAALIADPSAAHPLTDSELGLNAGGVLYTDPTSNDAFLFAHGLPMLPADQRYQIWLFTESGERISAGSIAGGPDDIVQGLIRAPEPFAAYWAIGLSAEPDAGSAEPTAPLALGGWLR
ncbi:MAG: anti-sigma factor domain-containing protein [Thermomicrobiales bacterium]